MTNFIITSVLLILAMNSTSFASADMDKILSSLPSKLIGVEVENGIPVIRKGKCCSDEVDRNFIRKGQNWYFKRSLGFEEVEDKIESAERVDGNVVFRRKDAMCESCPVVLTTLKRDSKKPFLWKLDGKDFIDDKARSKAKVIIEDDCPTDGEAC